MDHQTFAQLLGNYGEFFGAIAVVATLIYLAGQLRQNTRALRSSSYDAYSASAAHSMNFQGQHATDLAEIIDSDKQYAELNTKQRLLMDVFTFGNFNLIELTYLHHRAGTMDDQVFDGKVQGFRSWMGNPNAQEAWDRNRRNYSLEFQDFMDTEIVAKATGSAPLFFDRPSERA